MSRWPEMTPPVGVDREQAVRSKQAPNTLAHADLPPDLARALGECASAGDLESWLRTGDSSAMGSPGVLKRGF
jgi:hypothetical protein